jgi:uncharacterized repeat protein (TIGR01451 family)
MLAAAAATAADDPPRGLTRGDWRQIQRSIAASFVHEAQLQPSDGMAGDKFGWSVSISGDTVVVGVHLHDPPAGANAGAAYVFVRSGTTWTEQQELLASDGAPDDAFGYSVSISGNTIVVGAPYSDLPGSNAGSAYVFLRQGTTWMQQQKLGAPDAALEDQFGFAVAISGDTVLLGARADDTGAGPDSGSAYVFTRTSTTWTFLQKLFPTPGSPDQYFGHSVALEGNTAVVGAPLDLGFAGSVFVFVRPVTFFSLQQMLTASDAVPNDFFGTSVSVSGDTVVGGSLYGDAPGATNSGAAYVFFRTGTSWAQQQKLVASDAASGDNFGGSVSVSGDTAVIGAFLHATPVATVGAAYVFQRAGTTWTEQQELVSPVGQPAASFGFSVSLSLDAVCVGAVSDGPAGSAHIFRSDVLADLGVTKSDGQTTAVPGAPLTYTIVAGNTGPTPAPGATVTDVFPAAFLGVTWTCAAAGGGTCAPGGSGDIHDTVSLPVGATATYTATGTVSASATGSLSNTATVAVPGGGIDPNSANNSNTDTDALAPEANLSIVKTDSPDPVPPGGALAYALAITNAGLSDAATVTVVDTLPAGVTFVSSTPGPPTCVFAGATLTCGLGTLAAAGSASVTIATTVNAPGGVLVNTATVSGATPDPDPSNNSASATTFVGQALAELTHGARALYDLAAQPGPAADQDVFRISQKPYSSYEVVVDATSGDIDAGAGPLVVRIGADGTTVVQASSPIGAGPSRSLRWSNLTAAVVEDQVIRVRSAGCGTDCGPDDVYQIRAYETTYAAPRFNNAGSQVTILLLQNPAAYPIAGEIHFRDPPGVLVAVQAFALSPKETLVLNTATVPGAGGVGGAITIAHDGRYGDLSGKTVAVEPATGFSFDSPLEPRVK